MANKHPESEIQAITSTGQGQGVRWTQTQLEFLSSQQPAVTASPWRNQASPLPRPIVTLRPWTSRSPTNPSLCASPGPGSSDQTPACYGYTSLLRIESRHYKSQKQNRFAMCALASLAHGMQAEQPVTPHILQRKDMMAKLLRSAQ